MLLAGSKTYLLWKSEIIMPLTSFRNTPLTPVRVLSNESTRIAIGSVGANFGVCPSCTRLPQTSFLPLLIQMYLRSGDALISPSFLQVAPGFTAARADGRFDERSKLAVTMIAGSRFMPLRVAIEL